MSNLEYIRTTEEGFVIWEIANQVKIRCGIAASNARKAPFECEYCEFPKKCREEIKEWLQAERSES